MPRGLPIIRLAAIHEYDHTLLKGLTLGNIHELTMREPRL